MDLKMTGFNRFMTLICLKQNPQCHKRVGFPGFLFRVINGEMEHSLHKRLTADPVANSGS